MGITEHRGVVPMHRDVGQVVEIGEQRDMAEFADSCDENETFLAFKCFDDGIKYFQLIQNLLSLRLPQVVQDRLVIFVHKNDNLFLFGKLVD